MANQVFDRVIINPRERPLSNDINQGTSQMDRTIRSLLETIYLGRQDLVTDSPADPLTGFFGAGFKVRAGNLGRSVTVSPGSGFFFDAGDLVQGIDRIVGVDDLSRWKPLTLIDSFTFQVPEIPGLDRVDIVEVKINRRVGDPSDRDVLNPATGLFEPGLVNKTLAWDLDGSTGDVVEPALSTASLSYKVGIAGAGTPATTPGYVKIADLILPSGIATVTRSHLSDLRRMLHPNQVGHASLSWFVDTSIVDLPIVDATHMPPGVEPVVTNPVGDGSRVFLFVGQPAFAQSPVAVGDVSQGGSGLDWAVVSQSISTVDAGIQAIINDPAISSPSFLPPLGAFVLDITIEATTTAQAQWKLSVDWRG